MGYMITMVSMPVKLFHKDWIAENAVKFTNAMKKQLLNASDKILKSLSAFEISQIQISIK